MFKKTLASIDRAVELSDGVPLDISNAAMYHYGFGNKEVADRHFENLKKRATDEYIAPVCFVYIYLALGDADHVFEWIKKAAEERDSFLPWLRVTPMDYWQFEFDPRIHELLDRLGLP